MLSLQIFFWVHNAQRDVKALMVTLYISTFCLCVNWGYSHQSDVILWELFPAMTIYNSDVYRQHRTPFRQWKYSKKKKKGEGGKQRKERLNSTVVLVPGDVDVRLRAAQSVIVHCLMVPSWEAVTRVCSSIQARPLTWCNLWASADIKDETTMSKTSRRVFMQVFKL